MVYRSTGSLSSISSLPDRQRSSDGETSRLLDPRRLAEREVEEWPGSREFEDSVESVEALDQPDLRVFFVGSLTDLNFPPISGDVSSLRSERRSGRLPW